MTKLLKQINDFRNDNKTLLHMRYWTFYRPCHWFSEEACSVTLILHVLLLLCYIEHLKTMDHIITNDVMSPKIASS